MSDESQDSAVQRFIKGYREWKDKHPIAYGVSAVLPGTGQVAAVADYTEAMDREDSTDSAVAAASLIPGVKLAKYATKLAPAALRVKGSMTAAERAIAPATKHSAEIGMTADAEQIGETATKEYQQAHDRDTEARVKQRQDFSTGFNGG